MLQITPTQSSVVRIQKARTALLLDHPFLGTPLFRLGARARSSIATMATDGMSLYFNPEFVEKLSSAELIGTLAHEVMHPAPDRTKARLSGYLKDLLPEKLLVVSAEVTSYAPTCTTNWQMDDKSTFRPCGSHSSACE